MKKMFTEASVLLEAAERDIARLEREVHEGGSEDPVEILLKRTLEAQRSALDFVARVVTEWFGRPASRVYYPLAPAAERFAPSIDGRMPGVRQARPDIAAAIERHQPFQPDGDWLEVLATLVNENKHERFTEHELVRVRRVLLRSGVDAVLFNPDKPWVAELAAGVGDLMAAETEPVRNEIEFEDVRLKQLGASAPSVLRAIQSSLRHAIDDIEAAVSKG